MISPFRHSIKSTSLAVGITALSLSSCATIPSDDGPPRGENRQERPARTSGTFLQPAALLFADMDSNADKVTSKAEMFAGTKAEWKNFGRNPSGTQFASWSLRALGSTDATPTFMSFDRDFNGVITQAEFSAQFEALFTRFDKNADGMLNRSEMIIAVEAPMGRANRRGEAAPRQQGGRGGRRPQRQ